MKNVLVVDDSAVVRSVARGILSGLGFACREARDGQEALARCAEAMPDVMLLDWNMPVMDGIECLKRLRQTPAGGKVKVIFCTTQNEIAQIEEALSAGADEYLMKPFDAVLVKDKFMQAGVL